ncbi:MAG: NAD(+) synthase [Muribaculaceae bacterium]
MYFGLMRVAALVPKVRVADCDFNASQIIEAAKQAAENGATVIVTPELGVTGYTCGDLFHQSTLLDASDCAVIDIMEQTAKLNAMIVVGAPLRCDGAIYNCAIALCKGRILGAVPKTYLPNYKEFYEKRWFTSAANLDSIYDIDLCGLRVSFGTKQMFFYSDMKVAIELCEDLWTPIPPASFAAIAGANVILNLSASNEVIGKHSYLMSLIKQQSARCRAAYVYASAGYGESTTDLVFAGNAVIAENGRVIAEGERFGIDGTRAIADVDIQMLNNERIAATSFADSKSLASESDYYNTELELDPLQPFDGVIMRPIARHPFVPSDVQILNDRCEEIINIQVAGLMRRLDHIHCSNLVVGVSGGLDSTLALLVAVKAFDRLKLDRSGIIGITMPGFGTTGRTYNNAITLMRALGITIKEISIVDAVKQHFADIDHDINNHNITYENSQARERTQILMDYANKCGGIVLGTGDLSELALGWATYNGDHMSMYGVNSSIPKTLVKYLVRWFATSGFATDNATSDTLLDIVDTPISPELIPADENGNIKQKTEDLVGPYELHDFFLYYMIRYGFNPEKIFTLCAKAYEGTYDKPFILRWLREFYRRFFQQQFKRSCLPDGPKVGSVSLSPRGDWRIPSDASATLWLAECDMIASRLNSGTKQLSHCLH